MRVQFIGILTGVVLALFSRDVHAEGTAILIAGNAPQHTRDLSQSAIATSIQTQGRKLIKASFSAKDAALVKGCLSSVEPWTCMKAAVASKGIDQIVVGAVDTGTSPTGTPEIRLSGYLVVSDLDFAIAEERRCGPCTDDTLASLASDLTRTQLRRLAVVRGRTKIRLHTTPPGASVTFDGETQGTSDTVLSTFPGSHAIRLELDGHHVETRTVEALEDRTVEVDVTMRPVNARRPIPPSDSRPSRLVPVLVGSAGVAGVVAGGVLVAIHDPPAPEGEVQREYYYPTRIPGIATAIGGVTAIAFSIYLWRRQSRSAVTAMRLPRGVAVAWMTSF